MKHYEYYPEDVLNTLEDKDSFSEKVIKMAAFIAAIYGLFKLSSYFKSKLKTNEELNTEEKESE